ncbi:MAG TPA: conjugative transposon protein TraN [Chryseolinea sp.]|jgi:conjugative transposon TraN protein|nr:conjugative transposon protein TraN [Chryseolinea sp.]HPM29963.1 conjugative transposon protein TraN [Chryseolinea sp.]
MLYFLKNLYTRILLGGYFVLAAFTAHGQPPPESKFVEVTFNKTSSIVFPSSITSVDRGSRDLLAQKAKGVNNVLQLKAGRTNFKETNLTVITADGKLHHFMVSYADKPKVFTIQVNESSETESNNARLLFQTELTSAEMQYYAENIFGSPPKVLKKRTSHSGMKLSLQGIYIQGNVMFYHLTIANNSNIPFHTDVLRFYVKDKQSVKRTASQEVSEVPLYQYGNTHEVKGKSTEDVVIALGKFTIPDAKLLAIEWMEKRGGRHLKLLIKNRTIVHASPVPSE